MPREADCHRRRLLDGRRHRPAQEICDLADRYDALVMVDDSHATGFIGANRAGTHELRGVMDRIDILTGTLGKALGGASGGYTSGARKSSAGCGSARGPICSPTAFRRSLLPPACASSTCSRPTTSCDSVYATTRATFARRMTAAGFDLVPGEHPIIPVMLGDAKLASEFSQRLLQHGVYVIGFLVPRRAPRQGANPHANVRCAHEQRIWRRQLRRLRLSVRNSAS